MSPCYNSSSNPPFPAAPSMPPGNSSVPSWMPDASISLSPGQVLVAPGGPFQLRKQLLLSRSGQTFPARMQMSPDEMRQRYWPAIYAPAPGGPIPLDLTVKPWPHQTLGIVDRGQVRDLTPAERDQLMARNDVCF